MVALSRCRADTNQEEVARKGWFCEAQPRLQLPRGRRQPVSQHQLGRALGRSTTRPAAVPPLPPIPPGTYVQPRPFSRSVVRCRVARGRFTLPGLAKKTKQRQAAEYPDGAATPPGLGCAGGVGDGGTGAGWGGEKAEGGPEGATPTAPKSLRMLRLPAAGASRCAECASGLRKW